MRCQKLFCLAVAVALIFSVGLTISSAADYPKRPITMICPWGAGGGTDAVSRIIATLLKKDLGVPVNVVNRTGGIVKKMAARGPIVLAVSGMIVILVMSFETNANK